mgnify:CR=1 FL=1
MADLSNVTIIGAGPSGLYAGILLRRLLPQARVRIFEQNPKGATFGFGVVFSDKALSFLQADDPETYALIVPHMEKWQDMALNLPAGQVVLDGIGFTAIGRLHLIALLTKRALDLGVEIAFDHKIGDVEALEGDVIIGADGLNSVVRQAMAAQFHPHMAHFNNHFAWFGANLPFDTLSQTFIETSQGPMNAHHYRYAPGKSTFIVECGPETFENFGFADMDEATSARRCSAEFADVLQGTQLVVNKSTWRRFPRLWCENWVAGRYVLLGDAAHTAHFSIGSGTRLAFEDAIALVQALAAHKDLPHALESYQQTRPPIARKIVDAANTSAQWYDGFGQKMALAPLDFAHDYLMRSGRISDERLQKIAPQFAQRYMQHRAAAAAPS